MNHHLRFATRRRVLRGAAIALSAGVLASCQHSHDRLLSVSESVPPRLAGDKPFVHVQCYFFTAPDDFELLKHTEGSHVAGIYSPQDGEKLVRSLKRRRGFELTSSPTLTVRQGEKGKIQATRELIYPTGYLPPKWPRDVNRPETPNDIFPVTPATPTKFETTDLGVMAEVEARKDASGNIAFEIALTHRSFQGFINYGTPIKAPARNALGGVVEVIITENRIEMPVIHAKHLQTAITIADGHYLALGGLKVDPNRILGERAKIPEGPHFEAEKNLFALIKVQAVEAGAE